MFLRVSQIDILSRTYLAATKHTLVFNLIYKLSTSILFLEMERSERTYKLICFSARCQAMFNLICYVNIAVH